jgi:predicted oxidoreductase
MKQRSLLYGCMGIGGSWDTSPISTEDLLNAEKTVFAAIESGITRFDHADIYTLGKSEEVFGRVLEMHPGMRETIQIQSKASIEYHKGVNQSNTYNFSKAYIISKIEEILKRLGTDYLDMFLFHRPDPLISASEFAEITESLIASGKVKAIGVSNMAPSGIRLFNTFCTNKIMANQIQFSLNHTLLLNEITEYNNFTVVDSGLFADAAIDRYEIQAWGPLDKGLFTDIENKSDLPEYVLETNKLIRELSEKYKSNPSAILLAWIYSLPYDITPVIGTTNPKRIKDCTESLSIELDRDDWYNLWISARNQKLQ